jgi:hypothetical protein
MIGKNDFTAGSAGDLRGLLQSKLNGRYVIRK